MSEKFPLNDTLSPINPQTWAELNENWDRIKSYFRHLQGQVNILAGGEEIDEVINRIDAAIINATNATETANQIIDTLNIELPKVLTALENAETAIRNAETATASAQSATSAANVATGNANDATTAAINATNETNTAKSATETATINANTATTDALEATELATNAKNDAVTATNEALSAITEMRQLINNFLHRGDWNSATNYSKNNLVSANGQTYIAIQNNINKVVTDTMNWRLFASKGEKGDKGDTGAALSILDQLTTESELPPTGEPGNAYTVNGDLYVWSENSSQWINVGNIKGEKGENGLNAYQIALVDGFVGTESEWLQSLKGERGEKGENGSDATVTLQNITSALGYTPADNTDLTAHSTQIASPTQLGHIMPDGETIIVDPETGLASSVGGTSETVTQHINDQRIHVTEEKQNNWNYAFNSTRVDGRLGPVCKMILDWNTIDANGWYMAQNALNAPTDAWYMGQVIVHNADYIVQRIMAFAEDTSDSPIKTYIRRSTSGTWGPWLRENMLGNPTTLSLVGGWEHANANNPLRFYKDPFGVVHVYGRIKATASNTSNAVTILPVGYRPKIDREFVAISGVNTPASISISPYGQIDAFATMTVGSLVLINASFPTTV